MISDRDYRTVWRWHFYAGLFCLPFIVLLALTGSIYLFKPQIESWLDRADCLQRAPAGAGRFSRLDLAARAARAAENFFSQELAGPGGSGDDLSRITGML